MSSETMYLLSGVNVCGRVRSIFNGGWLVNVMSVGTLLSVCVFAASHEYALSFTVRGDLQVVG